MSVPGYYGCDCDKYNPDCRCYPRTAKPVPPGNALREAVARASWESKPTFGPPERLHQRTPWDELDDVAKEMVRENNEAAIAAVLDHLIVDSHSFEAGALLSPEDMRVYLRSFREAGQ